MPDTNPACQWGSSNQGSLTGSGNGAFSATNTTITVTVNSTTVTNNPSHDNGTSIPVVAVRPPVPPGSPSVPTTTTTTVTTITTTTVEQTTGENIPIPIYQADDYTYYVDPQISYTNIPVIDEIASIITDWINPYRVNNNTGETETIPTGIPASVGNGALQLTIVDTTTISTTTTFDQGGNVLSVDQDVSTHSSATVDHNYGTGWISDQYLNPPEPYGYGGFR
jgi:hypothetical protein